MALSVLVILICFHAETLTLAAAFLLDEDIHLGVSGFQFILDLGDQRLGLFDEAAIVAIGKAQARLGVHGDGVVGGATAEAAKTCPELHSDVANACNLLNCVGMVATGIHATVTSGAVLDFNCNTLAVSALFLGQLVDL